MINIKSSILQFPHLQNGGNSSIFTHRAVVRIQWDDTRKTFKNLLVERATYKFLPYYSYSVYLIWDKAGTGQASVGLCKDLGLTSASWDEFSSCSKNFSTFFHCVAHLGTPGPSGSNLCPPFLCHRLQFAPACKRFVSSFWKTPIHSSKPYSDVLSYRKTSLKFSLKRRELWALCLQPIPAFKVVFSNWPLNIYAIWTLTA